MIRAWFAILLLVVPAVVAQEGETENPDSPWVLLLEDPAGDQQMTDSPSADLRSLQARWAPPMIEWDLERNLDELPADVLLYDTIEYSLAFSYGGRAHRIVVDQRTSLPDMASMTTSYSLNLQELRNGIWWDTEDGETPIVEGNHILFQTPESWIRDARDAPLHPGSVLEELRVLARTEFGGNSALTTQDASQDRMPNEGSVGGFTKPPLPPSEGAYRFDVVEDVRVSNGGPSLLVYEADLVNGASRPETFHLSVEGAPSAWNVRFVPDRVTLDSLESAHVYILVESLGAHSHGGDDVFDLVATGVKAEARHEFRLHYPEIAELSGHHPEVWFHGRETIQPVVPGFVEEDITPDPVFPPDGVFWMNTAQDHDGEVTYPLSAQGQQPDGLEAWNIPLGPAPRLGFEFDMEKVGLLAFTLAPYHALDIEGLALVNDLQARINGSWVSVGDVEDVETFVLPAQGMSFELNIAPTMQFLAYTPDLQLRLRIAYDYGPTGMSSGLGTNQPMLVAGGKALLPVGEYFDPLPPELQILFESEGVIDGSGDLVDPVDPVAVNTPGLGLAVLLVGLLALVSRRK